MKTGNEIFLGMMGNEYQSANGKDLLKMDLEALDKESDEQDDKIEAFGYIIEDCESWANEFLDKFEQDLQNEDMDEESFKVLTVNRINKLKELTKN